MNKGNKDALSITISPNTIQLYRQLCKDHGMKISTRIEILIEQDIIKLQQRTK